LLCLRDTATPMTYTLSLHDALPIFEHAYDSKTSLAVVERLLVLSYALNKVCRLGFEGFHLFHPRCPHVPCAIAYKLLINSFTVRSEEHTSELQSRSDLVCRLLLEKK